MQSEIRIPRKWALKAHGKQVVFVKGLYTESSEQVLMKALLWALYLPQYPDLTVEISIGDRYIPDVVSLDEWRKPRFWGEAGQVGVEKIHALSRRFKDTHFAIAKWGKRLDSIAGIVSDALEKIERRAPFDLISFPTDSLTRFIDPKGNIHVSFEEVEWQRFQP
jgi:hypothetical protein